MLEELAMKAIELKWRIDGAIEDDHIEDINEQIIELAETCASVKAGSLSDIKAKAEVYFSAFSCLLKVGPPELSCLSHHRRHPGHQSVELNANCTSRE